MPEAGVGSGWDARPGGGLRERLGAEVRNARRPLPDSVHTQVNRDKKAVSLTGRGRVDAPATRPSGLIGEDKVAQVDQLLETDADLVDGL